MENIILFFIISQCTGQFYGNYEVRLEHGNTGRVYVAEHGSFGIGHFGTVCRGYLKIQNN